MKKRNLLLGTLLLLASCNDNTIVTEANDPVTGSEEDTVQVTEEEPITPETKVLYNFDDITTGKTGFSSLTDGLGGSVISFSTSDGVGVAHYTLDQAESPYDPFVKLAVSPNDSDSYDVSQFEGISYRYRGKGHIFFFEVAEVVDYAHFKYELPYSFDWDTVKIHFENDLKQISWGEQIPFSAENLLTLSWGVLGATGDTGTFQIDDVTLLKTVEREPLYDMEIKEPEIPELLPVTAGTITNPNQEKVLKYLNKGVCLASWMETVEPFSSFKYDADRIRKFAAQGFKGIRFPIDLDKWVIDKDDVIAGTEPFTLDPEIFMILDSMLLWTEQNGLSLTIDYHQYDGSLNRLSVSDPGYRAMAANCWKAVAQYYNDNRREDLFYELTNEPGIYEDVDNDEWEILAQEMLDSIRSIDAERPVIYGVSRWYTIDVLITTPLFAPDDENLIYAFHFYEPFIFTHQAADWASLGSTGGVPYPYSKEKWSTEYYDFGVTFATPSWYKNEFQNYYKNGNKNAMMNDLIPVRNWAVENNVAVICNEFGAYELRSDPESLKNYFIDAVAIFEELNIPWATWFGTFDENNELIPGIAGPLGLTE